MWYLPGLACWVVYTTNTALVVVSLMNDIIGQSVCVHALMGTYTSAFMCPSVCVCKCNV